MIPTDPLPIEARQNLDPDSDGFDRVLIDAMLTVCRPVAYGVLADVYDNGGWVNVRGVLASTPRVPGAVGDWLDTLPKDRRVIVWAVTSRRLAEMLQRRGFTCCVRFDQMMNLWDAGAMVRDGQPISQPAKRDPWWRALARRLGMIR